MIEPGRRVSCRVSCGKPGTTFTAIDNEFDIGGTLCHEPLLSPTPVCPVQAVHPLCACRVSVEYGELVGARTARTNVACRDSAETR